MGYCKICVGTPESPCPHVEQECRGCLNWHSDEIKTEAPGSKPEPGDVIYNGVSRAMPIFPPESPNLPKIDSLKRAKELANDHWEWLGGLFDRLGIEDSIGKYLYKTAFIHGYKHAIEDIKSKEKD